MPAQFDISAQARKHIIERIGERFLVAEPEDARALEQAAELLDDAVAALEQYTPDDWRFTRNPAAQFFLSLISTNPRNRSAHPDEIQLKLLGGSLRAGDAGKELQESLTHLCAQLIDSRDDLTTATVRKELERLADLYLEDLQDPAAPIVHELKTAYDPWADIAQRSRNKRVAFNAYRHTLILRAMKAHSLHAALPNGLLCQNDDGAYNVWVRQGHTWLAPKLNPAEKASEMALFCPLTLEGPVHNEARLWSFDTQGKVKCCEEADIPASHKPATCTLPDGFRSENYWQIPTRLDAMWLDYDYLHREQALSLSACDITTFTIINWIYDLASAKAEKSDPPAWFTKSKKT